MAWGNTSKTKAKTKPASKTKAKSTKRKKYSLNDRYYYHSDEKRVKSSDYSKGYT